jgi:hypothetical protein
MHETWRKKNRGRSKSRQKISLLKDSSKKPHPVWKECGIIDER